MFGLGVLAAFLYGQNTSLFITGIERTETHTHPDEYVVFVGSRFEPYGDLGGFSGQVQIMKGATHAQFTITVRSLNPSRTLTGHYDTHYPSWVEGFTVAHLSELEKACLDGNAPVVVRIRGDELPPNLPVQAYRQLVEHVGVS